MKGIDLIAKERQEQITKHGYTMLSDVENNKDAQLLDGVIGLFSNGILGMVPDGWDTINWAKMCNNSYRDRLIIAGALIAAEIDRLDYGK